MPLSTFHNLPQPRQQEILDIAFGEFALNGYNSASLSAIVKRTGVAKGSFYRYFESKQDLYLYLIDRATKMRLEKVEKLFAQTPDFEELLVENFRARIHFDLQYPLYSGFLYRVTEEHEAEGLGDIALQTQGQVTRLIEGLLQKYQQAGKVRSDIDLSLMAWFVLQVQFGIYDFLAWKFGINYKAYILRQQPVPGLPEERVLEVARGFSRLIVEGIS